MVVGVGNGKLGTENGAPPAALPALQEAIRGFREPGTLRADSLQREANDPKPIFATFTSHARHREAARRLVQVGQELPDGAAFPSLMAKGSTEYAKPRIKLDEDLEPFRREIDKTVDFFSRTKETAQAEEVAAVMPMKSGMQCVSPSSLSEPPTAAAKAPPNANNRVTMAIPKKTGEEGRVMSGTPGLIHFDSL